MLGGLSFVTQRRLCASKSVPLIPENLSLPHPILLLVLHVIQDYNDGDGAPLPYVDGCTITNGTCDASMLMTLTKVDELKAVELNLTGVEADGAVREVNPMMGNGVPGYDTGQDPRRPACRYPFT